MNQELPDVQAGFQRGGGTRVQIANICWAMGKIRDSRKASTSASLTMLKPLTVWSTTKWNILKERGILEHLTCLLRNFYAGQEATVRTRQGTTDWFKIGKGIRQGCVLSFYLFNLYAEYIMQNARIDESQAGIKIARRNISNLRYADDTFFMTMQRRTKEPLHESERGQ